TSLWRTHCCTGRTRPSTGSGRPPRAGSPVIRCSSGIRSSITSAVIRASSRSCASRRPSGSGTAQRCKQPAGLTDMVARRLFEAMRRYLWTFLGLTLAATPLEAQGLRDKISQLFIFADGKDPLFLGGTAGSDSATALHADHFVPSAVSDNGTLISFIGTAISQNVANLPVSATSGGSTFRFEGGVPVPTSRSPGSVFSERAQTLGRGRVFVGANVNRLHLETLRGVSDAQIFPFGGTTAQHFSGGTPANPQLSTSRFVEGSATGIGDIAARVKVNVTQTERTTFAVLGDVRFPTGSEDDLLGSGH